MSLVPLSEACIAGGRARSGIEVARDPDAFWKVKRKPRKRYENGIVPIQYRGDNLDETVSP